MLAAPVTTPAPSSQPGPDHRPNPVRMVTTKTLDPALSILTLARQRPLGTRKPGFKVTMPPLPGHHSAAEKTARRKNRVLDRLLQADLKDLARNKHNALVEMRVEAVRFRQRAVDLSNLLNDLQADDSDTDSADGRSYHPFATSSGNGPRSTAVKTRPKTSVGFRECTQSFRNSAAKTFSGNNQQSRPRTSPGKHKNTQYMAARDSPTSAQKSSISAHKPPTSPRKVPTSTRGWSAPQSAAWGESAHGRPLFRVRGKKVRGLVTLDDDTESESDTESFSDYEDSDTESSSDERRETKTKSTVAKSDFGRHGFSSMRKKVSDERFSNKNCERFPTQTKLLPQRTSSRGSLRAGRSLPPKSATHASYVPRSATGMRGGSRDITGVSKGQTTLQTSSIPRARSAKLHQGVNVSPTSETGNFRDPEYMKFVLGLEKDKYEINQGKIRKYLQNLPF